MTTAHIDERRPLAVLVVTAGALAALAVASWTVPPPPSDTVFRSASGAAVAAPPVLQRLAEHAAEVGVVVLAAALLVLAWRTRSTGTAGRARSLVAGGAAVVAYATSEGLKLVLTQARPCATLGLDVLAECPGPGDWSLPSNHATVAAALAAAVALLAPRLAVPAVVTAVAVAAARVATGVHYPHDVVTGLVLGSGVVAVVVLLLQRPAEVLLASTERRVSRRWQHRRTGRGGK